MVATVNASTLSGVIVTSDTSGALALQTAGTTALTIDSSQNVGIGTTSPASDTANERILQVNAPTTFSTVSLSTSRANTDGQTIGKLSFDVLNNTATYRSRAQITSQSSGSTANKYGGTLQFFTASDNVTDATERMRLNSTGALVLQGGTTTANGVGIAFPATQSASTDPNTLDDYEEGTWTPNVQNTSSTSTWSTKTGRYTKIGRFVYCSFVCDSGNTGTAGSALVVSGLPFTYGGTSNVPTLTGFTANGLASTEYITSRTQNGSTSFSITTIQGTTLTVQLTFATGTIVYEV